MGKNYIFAGAAFLLLVGGSTIAFSGSTSSTEIRYDISGVSDEQLPFTRSYIVAVQSSFATIEGAALLDPAFCVGRSLTNGLNENQSQFIRKLALSAVRLANSPKPAFQETLNSLSAEYDQDMIAMFERLSSISTSCKAEIWHRRALDTAV